MSATIAPSGQTGPTDAHAAPTEHPARARTGRVAATLRDLDHDTRTGHLVVGLFLLAWIVTCWHRVVAPLGLSHDGQNGSVFGSGARAVFEAGPLSSRLGSHLADGNGVYANHPPGLTWLIAAFRLVGGDATWTIRLPVAMATVVLVLGTYRLLRTVGIGATAAAAGVVAALGTPMLFVYGSMADTPMLGLPVAVWLLGDLARVERRLPVPSWRLVALGAGCALSSWEAVAMCVAALVVGEVRARRWQCPARPLRLVAAGLAGGLVLTVAWIGWSIGSFSAIASSFLTRTGGHAAPFGVTEAARVQIGYLADVYGIVLAAALLAGWWAVRLPSVRRLLGVTAAVAVAYQLVFWQAATIHDYWSYWWQLPMAVAIAGAVELAGRGVDGRAQTVALLFAVALGPLWTLAGSSTAERSYADGVSVDDLLAPSLRPSGQTRMLTLGLGEPLAWASWRSHLPVQQLTLATVGEVASVHPRWKVLVLCDAPRAHGGVSPCDSLAAGIPTRHGVVLVDVAALERAVG